MGSLGQEWESQLLEGGILLVTSVLDGRLKGDQLSLDGLQIDLVFAFACADVAGDIDVTILDQLGANGFLRAATKQDAMGRDDGHHAIIFEDVKTLEKEGEVSGRFGGETMIFSSALPLFKSLNILPIDLIPDFQRDERTVRFQFGIIMSQFSLRCGFEVAGEVVQEEKGEHVVAEISRIHRPAQLVRDGPEGFAELGLVGVTHGEVGAQFWPQAEMRSASTRSITASWLISLA